MPEIKPSNTAENEYIQIKEVPPSRPGALTRKFGVYSKSSAIILGYISWYPQWRQYTFSPEGHTVFNPVCLDFISKFIVSLMEERKDK